LIRIVAAEARPKTFRLVEGYRIAGHRFDRADMVLLKIATSDGRTGYGCAAPAEDVTGETAAESLRVLRDVLIPMLLESDVGDLPGALSRVEVAAPAAPAARAAADMAFYDQAARREGLPLARFLGSERTGLPTSITLGIEDSLDAAVAQGRRRAGEGFRIFKIKVGEDWEFDAALVKALRAALGPTRVIRADANQGYSEADAARFLAVAADCGVELLEQPVAAADLAALSRLGRLTPVPVMADEALLSEADAQRLIAAQAGSLFNIKLMKCGGIHPGLAIARRAAASGVGVMVGCNDESRIAIAAGLHFALAAPACDRADLDGHLDLQDDVARGGVRLRDGVLERLDEPGLGVSVDF
jgi:L-alanine-DL-glutamate epimerase-like enolase superfamily enzyme